VIGFEANIDPEDAENLSLRLDELEAPITFSVEVEYSDLNGEQQSRTLVEVKGMREYWQVTDVSLYEGVNTEPFIVLHREVEVAESPPPA
jgi:hypothetical protein